MEAGEAVDLVGEGREDIKLILHLFLLKTHRIFHYPKSTKRGGQYEYLCGQLISGYD
jgi:hypothetical protein